MTGNIYKIIPKCSTFICDALYGLVPFVQFKKREKHPWRSVTFRLKVTLLYGCFTFLKLYKWY